MRTTFLIMFLSIGSWVMGQQSGGTLRLVSREPGECVEIDGKVMTWTDQPIPVSSGKHRVIAKQKDRIAVNKPDFVTAIEIAPGENLEIDVSWKTLGIINSYPSGVVIQHQGESVGVTPFEGDLSRYLGGSLAFSKHGYQNAAVSVDDSIVQKNFVFVTLIPSPRNAVTNENLFVNQKWKESGPYPHKTMILANLSMAVVFGSAAAYYKKKADDAFEKAKLARHVGNLERTRALQRKTDKNDRLALVGFIGLQLNITSLMYFLLISK